MTFRPINDPSHLYFITATISGWRSIFYDPDLAWIVLNSLHWLATHDRMILYAFVLMPNHLHFLCKPIAPFNISMLQQNFGSFTAHEILRYLRETRATNLLQFFREAARYKGGQRHKIWQDIQGKNIFSQEVLVQKIEYLHNNPVQPKWALVENRWSWKYSSACFYDLGKPPVIPVTDVRTLLI